MEYTTNSRSPSAVANGASHQRSVRLVLPNGMLLGVVATTALLLGKAAATSLISHPPRDCAGGGGGAASSGLFRFRPTPVQRRPSPTHHKTLSVDAPVASENPSNDTRDNELAQE